MTTILARVLLNRGVDGSILLLFCCKVIDEVGQVQSTADLLRLLLHLVTDQLAVVQTEQNR